MRLERLVLERYGLFSGHVIDFGPAPATGPDLHVIYGENEAGKTTTLSAFLDLLFGFELRSAYGYRHGYESMRVAADLALDGQSRRFSRIRRRRGSLIDEQGDAVADSSLSGQLGGMDRTAYRAMFSLDDQTLEQGGDAILRSEGDLGELLFAGSSGLVETARVLEDLREQADGFYRRRARNTRLAALRQRLDSLDDQLRERDIGAARYSTLVKERDSSRAALDQQAQSVAKLEAEIGRLKGLRTALPWLQQLREARGKIAAMKDLPDVPSDLSGRITALQRGQPELRQRLARQKAVVARDVEELQSIDIDASILDAAVSMRELDGLRARHVTAEKDLPDRSVRLAELEAQVASEVRGLARDPETHDPASLLLPGPLVEQLRELAQRRSGHEVACRSATEERDDAARTVEQCRARMSAHADAGAGDDALVVLDLALQAAVADDSEARLLLHQPLRDQLQRTLEDQLAELHPWSGDVERLAFLRVPHQEQVEAWKRENELTASELGDAAREEQRLRAQCRHLTRRSEHILEQAGLVDDGEAARVRNDRNAAWDHHRAKLDAGSADLFAAALEEDDRVTAARLGGATELAKLRQAADDLVQTGADLDRVCTIREVAQQRLTALRGEVATAIEHMGAPELATDMSVDQLEGWLGRRARVLETRRQVREQDAGIERAYTDARGVRDRLRQALDRAETPWLRDDGVDVLQRRASRVIEQERARQVRHETASGALEEAELELGRRETVLRRAREAEERWEARWRDTLAGCWLHTADAGVSRIMALVDAAQRLASMIEERRDLARRVTAMHGDQNLFRKGVEAVCLRIGITPEAEQPLVQYDGLNARLASAIAANDRATQLAERIRDGRTEIGTIEAESAPLEQEEREILDLLGCGSLIDAARCMQQVGERRQLREREEEAARHVLEATGATSLPDAEQMLADIDRTVLDEQIGRLELENGTARKLAEGLRDQHVRASDAVDAVGGDDSVAAIEEQRRTVLLEIEEGVLDWLRIRLGIEAATRALDAYRREHRSSMMQRAAEAFRTVTRGAYTGLATQPTERGEELLAEGPEGTRRAAQLSKGTRFQLYLALRVAGYREFVDRHGPVPFVADDILETFDDFRAEEAFRLFAHMGEAGQVIYLGHHRHLCDIARTVCPEVRIHRLPAPRSPGPGC